jgi:uroporphyrinogen decarboxylase
MNKREVVLSLLHTQNVSSYIPAGFFIHFDPSYHHGQAAIDKHLEYFHYTGMDFLKIQYELSFPKYPDIKKPEDWVKFLPLTDNYFEDQWKIADGLVKAAGKNSLVIMTLYSPFMCAGQVVGRELLDKQIKENPENIKRGMEIVTDSLLTFAKGCIDRGIDGFYHSTQGYETYRFTDPTYFEECIKPYDMVIMGEINNNSIFNILHICDFHGSYTDYSPFLDYPGDVVNCSLSLGSDLLTGSEISQVFGRPFMGGLDRHGSIVSGNLIEIQDSIKTVINNSPEVIILGADCTLPGNVDWENIKNAISFAHEFSGN